MGGRQMREVAGRGIRWGLRPARGRAHGWRRGALRSGALATGLVAALALQTLGLAQWGAEQCVTWPRNEAGQTYCPADARLVGRYPDLVAVRLGAGTPDERVAYVYGAELAEADGSSVGSPEEAVAYADARAARAEEAFHEALSAELAGRAAVSRADARELRRRLHSVTAPGEDAVALLRELVPGLAEADARALLGRVRERASDLAATRLTAYELDGVTMAGEYVLGRP